MRFRVRVDVCLEASDLPEAQAAADAMTEAALAAAGEPVVADPEAGSITRTELEPLDDEAVAAVTAEGLGPGIDTASFRCRSDTEEP